MVADAIDLSDRAGDCSYRSGQLYSPGSIHLLSFLTC